MNSVTLSNYLQRHLKTVEKDETVSLFQHRATKTKAGVVVKIHAFLNSALAGSEWSGSWTGRYINTAEGRRYPLDRKLGITQQWSRGKCPPQPGMKPQSSKLQPDTLLTDLPGPNKIYKHKYAFTFCTVDHVNRNL
jgi:hypothetical protein